MINTEPGGSDTGLVHTQRRQSCEGCSYCLKAEEHKDCHSHQKVGEKHGTDSPPETRQGETLAPRIVRGHISYSK